MPQVGGLDVVEDLVDQPPDLNRALRAGGRTSHPRREGVVHEGVDHALLQPLEGVQPLGHREHERQERGQREEGEVRERGGLLHAAVPVEAARGDQDHAGQPHRGGAKLREVGDVDVPDVVPHEARDAGQPTPAAPATLRGDVRLAHAPAPPTPAVTRGGPEWSRTSKGNERSISGLVERPSARCVAPSRAHRTARAPARGRAARAPARLARGRGTAARAPGGSSRRPRRAARSAPCCAAR